MTRFVCPLDGMDYSNSYERIVMNCSGSVGMAREGSDSILVAIQNICGFRVIQEGFLTIRRCGVN